MNAIQEAVTQLVRGPRAGRLLKRLGIDPRRYWLLLDLFGELSDRGEMLDQLGTNGVALEKVAWAYFAMSALLTLGLVVARPAMATYLLTFLLFTAFLLLSILLSETGNSLVNPVEGLVLAHQPIDGATYTAAKLTHLSRIILYLVPGLNAVPALAGLALKGAGWSYPFLHLAAAFAVGVVAALLCCALFGWLIRFLPARRVRAAGQLAATVPFLGMVLLGQIWKVAARLDIHHRLPAQPAVRWGMAAAGGAVAVAVVAVGIRSLSIDYLIRVSSMMRGGAALGSKPRKSRTGGVIARFFGGQAARAGFAFVSRLMLRDWQFRRQLVPMVLPALIGLTGLVASGWRTDPFSGRFTPMHLLPHFLGMLLYFVCNLLPYGSDYKGAWIFLLAPSRGFGGFARGVHALLWIDVIVIPHAIVFPLLAWSWGMWHAGLFVAYSLAAGSVYLALELRLIDGVPFSKQMDASHGAFNLAVVIIGGIAVSIAVGLQYLLVFRSTAVVAVTTVALGVTAYFVTRTSLGAFAASIRHSLVMVSGEAGTLYREVN